MAKPEQRDTRHELIASAQNARFRNLMALVESAHERRKAGRSVLEGHKLIVAFSGRATATEDRGSLQAVFVSERLLTKSWADEFVEALQCEPVVLADRLFRQVSRQKNPDGAMAIIETPRPDLPCEVHGDIVYLDGIQDPGNLGTILRTCAAAGVKHVLTSPGTAYCWSPKVLRAAMGAHFVLSIHEGVGNDGLTTVAGSDRPRWATVAENACPPGAELDHGDGGRVLPIDEIDLRLPGVWLFGAEGQGLSRHLMTGHVVRVAIDQDSAVESLNVAAAVAVCLFEQRRQRRRQKG